jgi:hypothetical protein
MIAYGGILHKSSPGNQRQLAPVGTRCDAVGRLRRARTHVQPHQQTGPLLEREQWLNDKCRGGSRDDPATADYCAVRDRAAEQLQAKGWCWGQPEQIEALKKWQRCKVASGAAACIASIDRHQRAVAIAFVATICQLRSDRYLAQFKQARDSAYFSAPACARLPDAESGQVDAEMARIFVDEQSKIGLVEGQLSRTFAQACQTLREGHSLVDLDRKARSPTGK